MEKEEIINMDELDSRFTCEIASQPGGEHVMMYVQCAICSSGCPESVAVCSFTDNQVLKEVEVSCEVI